MAPMKNCPNVDLLELLLDTSLLTPDHATTINSWHRHIPFAFALMRIMRPKVFVELGTHRGDSYSAFCQARQHFQLETECSAVDSWEGDSQAGYYGDEIFSELRESHDPTYGDFSQLLRMRFDQALPLFPDGGIDLLHIDGLHTYEAVKEDYESWLPKMSAAGVILFHDTNVLNRDDFGVWRLWREVTLGKPNFEFKFGYGLGVLATGEKVPNLVLDFLRWATAAPEIVNRFFWVQGSDIEAQQLPIVADKRDKLGTALGYAQSIVAERDAQLKVANSALEKAGERLTWAQLIVTERDAQLESLNNVIKETGAQLTKAQSSVIEKDARLKTLNSSLEKAREQLDTVRTTVFERDSQLEVLTSLLSESHARLQRLVGSRWWRLRTKIFSILGRNNKIVTTNHSSS